METAQKHLQAERTKADLITNVSHDIKTPLTSIINYVDLLKQARTETEKAQYLAVLSNQSQRLKRLIDDLIELSKASSGSLQVELSAMDAAEAVNQALGEFSERLEAVELTPVFTAPDESITMVADGKLFWRVISNLLSNAIKYAMPGTRLYIDLAQHEDKVLISLKNVSKEKLRASSEYLLERFAQGDTSRNTEGSGLGLNIAKTLMEVQQGRLQLVADGDLFKVTLVFPAGDCS
jgi:K+-sensing histidine kinase KdpD